MINNKDLQWLKLCHSGSEIFSSCGKRKYFCLIVNSNNQIVGQGYNGVPSGMRHCEDGGCPRFINNVPHGTPYDYGDGLCYSSHAEQNALARSNSLEFPNSTLYVNGFPCLTCAKQIASAGIKKIVIIEDNYRLDMEVASKFLSDAGVQLIEVQLESFKGK